jgi:hypothetical protein
LHHFDLSSSSRRRRETVFWRHCKVPDFRRLELGVEQSFQQLTANPNQRQRRLEIVLSEATPGQTAVSLATTNSTKQTPDVSKFSRAKASK